MRLVSHSTRTLTRIIAVTVGLIVLGVLVSGPASASHGLGRTTTAKKHKAAPKKRKKATACMKSGKSKKKRRTCSKTKAKKHAATPSPVAPPAPTTSASTTPAPAVPVSSPRPAAALPIDVRTEVVGFGPFKELTTPTETTLEANIDPEGTDVKYHFDYGPTTSYGMNAPTPDGDAGAGFAPDEVKLKVTGLTPQTTYHERVVAEYAGKVYDGPDYSFTTGPWDPEPESYVWILNVSATEATLRDNVNPGYADTKAHFEYGETETLGNNSPEVDLGSGGMRVPIECTLKGLKASTKYYFQVEATNSIGAVHGILFVFTTPS